MNRHVVITGMGCVSGLGIGVDEAWERLAAGQGAIAPIARGGMEGCVEVIETRRSTGSSALSACSYDEPDRPSMTIVYQNNCGFAVDVETRIAMDTGESDSWTEYDLRPGRRRSTADLCGLISYEFAYEEHD